MAKKTETMEMAKVQPVTIAVPDGFASAWGEMPQGGPVRFVLVQPVMADEGRLPGQFFCTTTETTLPQLDVSLLASTERCHHPAYDSAGNMIPDMPSACWSPDGLAPDARVAEPFGQTCREMGDRGYLQPVCPELVWPEGGGKPKCNLQIVLALYEWSMGLPAVFVCQKSALQTARKLLSNLTVRARSIDRGAMPWHYRLTIKSVKMDTGKQVYYRPDFANIRVDREAGDQIAHLAPAVKTADVQAMVATEKSQDEIPF